ncbi:hypothetical protein CW707_01685 [Candidatus Bathyarchaeota archaeon]|nr:MAG: hypothetical protein CW707_01685 [Candidatus Bathyarchaeota archaeon]
MKFKIELSLLISAIILYIVSTFCYSYEASSQNMLPIINYPYRDFALLLVGIASVFMVIAAILYSKRK